MGPQHQRPAAPVGTAQPALKLREKRKGSIHAFCLGFWAIAQRVQLDPTAAGRHFTPEGKERRPRALSFLSARPRAIYCCQCWRAGPGVLVLDAAGGWACWKGPGGNKRAGIHAMNRITAGRQRGQLMAGSGGAQGKGPPKVPPSGRGVLEMQHHRLSCRRDPCPAHPRPPTPPAISQRQHWCTENPGEPWYRAVWCWQNWGRYRMSAAQAS